MHCTVGSVWRLYSRVVAYPSPSENEINFFFFFFMISYAKITQQIQMAFKGITIHPFWAVHPVTAIYLIVYNDTSLTLFFLSACIPMPYQAITINAVAYLHWAVSLGTYAAVQGCTLYSHQSNLNFKQSRRRLREALKP